MSEIKRYMEQTIKPHNESSYKVIQRESANGKWCKHEDVKKLIEKQRDDMQVILGLKEYVKHKETCKRHGYNPYIGETYSTKRCPCGLDDLLKNIERILNENNKGTNE